MATDAEEYASAVGGETFSGLRASHDRKELLELYKAAIEEYRFEVRLNWARMQYFVVVVSGIIAAGTGLFARADTWEVAALCGFIFLIGAVMSVVALGAIKRGREYYRTTIYKKMLYEELLGLNNAIIDVQGPLASLAIGTTDGQRRIRPGQNFQTKVSWRKLVLRNKVTSYFVWVLILLALINLFATGTASIQVYQLLTSSEVARLDEVIEPNPPASVTATSTSDPLPARSTPESSVPLVEELGPPEGEASVRIPEQGLAPRQPE